MALPWRQIGMNTSIQYLAVGDRRVHRELSEMVVCSALTMAYHGIITQQVTTRSIARVCPSVCVELLCFLLGDSGLITMVICSKFNYWFDAEFAAEARACAAGVSCQLWRSYHVLTALS